jgi:hypothetical protein
MIKDRPAHLLAQAYYTAFPKTGFRVHFDALPELVRKSFGPLGGIQPVTGAMFNAAQGDLHDLPSPGEIELFRRAETQFQAIFVVMNIAHLNMGVEPPAAFPYALTLVPASKRGLIDVKTIDQIAVLDTQRLIAEAEFCYTGFDPFTGDYAMFGSLSAFMHGGGRPYDGFLDELGLVVGQYFLATSYNGNDVLEVALGLGNERGEEKYRKHRARLLYVPFGDVHTRRIWGAQSPIELFLYQELLRRGLSPALQILIYDDGTIYPSLYHLWREIQFRHSPGLISEPDMYFVDQKLAVFCDSAKHHRGAKAKAKDTTIDDRLKAIGVGSVRVPGKLIVDDLQAAGDLVSRRVENAAAP